MAKDERQQLIYDFKATFGTDAGQNVLRAIAKHCREDQNPYIQGSWDGTAYNCGMLEVIMYIRKQLAVSDEPRQTTVISEKENPNA